MGKIRQKTTESMEQQAVVQWFRLQYPNVRIIAIPNGSWISGSSSAGKFALINKYKAEGMTKGVSDLFICHSDGRNHGMWLEMKNVGKTEKSLTEEQVEWMGDMNKAGYIATWAAGQDKAISTIQDYMNGWYR